MLSCGNLAVYLIVLLIILLDDTTNRIVTIANDNLHIRDTLSTQELIAGAVFFEILEPIELQYTYRLRPAKDFGAPFNASFKLDKVKLIPTIPSDGCTDILNAEQIHGNVALIERGICSFLSKTINAEKIGAKAAIITESNTKSPEYDYYIEMVHDNTDRDVNIPAGFLLGKNARIIKATLGKLRKNYAIINIPVNLTFTPPHQMNYPPWLGF